MLTAERLRTTSRHDYLLYLWYVEDVLRAFGCDMESIEQGYLPRILGQIDEETQRTAVRRWYAELCEMMHSEGCVQSGHLQIVRNVEQELDELHRRLLQSPERFPDYNGLFQKALPALRELQQRNGTTEEADTRTMLGALYGLTLLTLQGKEISAPTKDACERFGSLLRNLSVYYLKDKEEPLDQ